MVPNSMYTVSELTETGTDTYALLDSGDEMKLERFGNVLVARPDPQALYPKRLPESEWQKADAWYERKGNGGTWRTKQPIASWQMQYGLDTFKLQLTSFKHTGLFPEQKRNWEWMTAKVEGRRVQGVVPKVLNLFGYTGGATLALARAGAEVVHLDASKSANAWARENAELSGLKDAPIRWITEDVRLFVSRELKRGNTYDAIVMDPPAFGHGPKSELWKIEEHLVPLIVDVQKLLSPHPLFVLMSGYAAGYSAHTFAHNLASLRTEKGGEITCGELLLQEKDSDRKLACGIYARWER